MLPAFSHGGQSLPERRAHRNFPRAGGVLSPKGAAVNLDIERLEETLHAAARRVAPLGPALARLTVGLVFIGTGWGKLHTLPDVTEYFASLHIPAPGLNARVAASTEFF